MKKILLSITFPLICLSHISYSTTPEQCALLATESLMDQTAYILIQKIYFQCGGDEGAIRQCICDYPYKNLDLTGYLAKWAHLRFGLLGKFIDPQNNYGFTVEELRVFNRIPAFKYVRFLGITLDLSDLRIIDLFGLSRIPGIDRVDYLKLSDNQIAELRPDTFMGFNNLRTLGLAGNKIKKIRKNAFDGLGRLRQLNLSHNQLSELSNVLKDLNGVQNVKLERNPLSKLKPSYFEGHDNLESLSLDSDSLSKGEMSALQASIQEMCPNAIVNFVDDGAGV